MKNILILIIILCTSFIASSCTKAKSAEEFAIHLQSIIANDDRVSFRELLKLQKPRDKAHKAEQVDYVFDNKSSNIRAMLTNEETNIYVKPFTNLTGDSTGKYIIIYYNPSVIDFTNSVSQEQLEAHWLSGYVETAIQSIGDGWFFVDSAFYQGSSPSWVEDY
ncbi:hypothetical protein ACUR5C_09395 [Aliikangiella sp. IMCC44653]